MKADIINYHQANNSGLIYININDGIMSFDNIFATNDNEYISIYDYLNINDIYCITSNNILYNECNTNGLYAIIDIMKSNNKLTAILFRINIDESEIISNIDSNSNYIKSNICKHKLYKAGVFNSKEFYYCYECGNYIWK